ncbi:MAG: ribonuclease E inhibitor RraB [Sphingomonas bacterium]
MTLPDVDPARLEEELLADQEVLLNLAKNGDRPEIARSIDVSFRGDDDDLTRLADDAGTFGFTVLEREEGEEGEISLFLARTQRADPASIKALTIECLQIELLYDLEFEGWGCMAETGEEG